MLKTGTITSLYHEHTDGIRYRFTCAAMDNHYLWLGTWGGGMDVYDINTHKWKQQTDGLKNRELALIAADNTSIWIAGRFKSGNAVDSGIACYTPFDNRWDYIYRSEKAAANTIGSNWVTCLLPDKDIVWFGYQGGVSRYDRSKQQWLSFTKKNALIDGNVKAIVNDKDGIWVITRWGINHFCCLNNKWKQYPYHLELNKYGEYLTASVVHNDTLWIAFSWLGVYRFDIKGGNWERVVLPEGFESSYVYCLISDSFSDGLWFGTDRGVLQLNDQAWESLTKQDGLISNKVFCINRDDEYVFFGTQAGVSMYCKQDGWIRNYTINDGLIDNDIRSIAILRDCVYFGTSVGITAFYYKKSKPFTVGLVKE
ncbi:MAG: hypothetical protein QME49_09805 [bacterium]|nr:hypothetical protein [bacterium]